MREIVFVNPDSDTIAARAKELFGDLARRPQIRILPISTSEFANVGMSSGLIYSTGRLIHPDVQVLNRPL